MVRRILLVVLLTLAFSTAATTQNKRLEGTQNTLDLKDVQVFEARLDAIKAQAQMLQLQLQALQGQFDGLSAKRLALLNDLYRRNGLDPKDWTIQVDTGELAPTKK